MTNLHLVSFSDDEVLVMIAAVLKNPSVAQDLKDWGVIPTMLEGESHTSGILIYKGEDGSSETGVWVCTPGFWTCEVERDEFCHFIEGRATYTHDSGEIIDIQPDTAAFFKAGWKGTCRVHETVRKVYMIR